MRNKDSVTIGDLYGNMLNEVKKTVVQESAVKSPPQNAFSSKSAKPTLAGGPASADGYETALHDSIMYAYSNPSANKVVKTNKGRQSEYYFGSTPKVTSKPSEEDEEVKDDEEIEDEEEDDVEEDEEDTDDSEDSDDSEKEDKKKEWVKPWEKDDDADEDEEILESKKISKKTLNKNMKTKSTFDTLYAKVLKEQFGMEEDGNDFGAVGIDDDPTDADLGDDFGGEGGEEDTVTFTLDRATAQTLIDVLQGALGGGEEDFGDEGEDDGLDFGDEGEDEGGGDFDEDEEGEAKPAPDKKAVFQSKNNKVGGKVKPKGGKASSEVTDEVGTKTNASTSYTDGKNNKVNTSVKPGDFFK